MPSPFGGVDPFVQRSWGDFHGSFTTYLRDHMNERLPPSLRAKIEENVKLQAEDEEDPGEMTTVGYRRPDTFVIERPGNGGGGLAVAEPDVATVTETEWFECGGYRLPFPDRTIEVRDRRGGRVVAVVELLSPTNKVQSPAEYVRRQEDYIRGQVHLLELDLLLNGVSVTAAARSGIVAKASARYHVSLLPAGGDVPRVWPVPLGRPLPNVALPLRPGEAPLMLKLQEVYDLTHDRGGYADELDDADLDLLPARWDDDERATLARGLAAAGAPVAPGGHG